MAATLLPGTPDPGQPRWYHERLDLGPRVIAGETGPRVTTTVTRKSSGLRVGLDGRVRDSLEVRTWSESWQTGTY